MNPTRRNIVRALVLLPWVGVAQAETSGSDLLAAVSGPEATKALRESLEQGARQAITTLGRENGFFGDPSVKIGLPKNFTRAEKFLRGVGYGQKIDDLILAMNRAAETATPKAQELLLESIRKMSISDAKAVLTGGDNAATEYFRKSTEAKLTETLMPVVKSVIEKSDFASAYNGLAGKLVEHHLAELSHLDHLGGQFRGRLDDPDNVSHRIIGIRSEDEIRGGKEEEMEDLVIDMGQDLTHLPELMTGGGGGDPKTSINRLVGGKMMHPRADATDPVDDPRNLFSWTSLDKFFKPA